MTVVWRPGGGRGSRERILLFGTEKVGKSKSALDIARKLKGDDMMYVIDADNAWQRLLEDDDQGGDAHGIKVYSEVWGDPNRPRRVAADELLDEDGHLVIFHTNGWDEHVKALDYVWANAGWDDWVVVDSISWLWSDIQAWYVKNMYGTDLPEFLFASRKKQLENDKKGGNDLLVDFQFINPFWVEHFAEPYVNARCHCLVIAEAKSMHPRDNAQTKTMFESVGHKPSAQPRLGHQSQTMIYVDKVMGGRRDQSPHRITTVGERGGRELLYNQPWDDFFVEYLKGIAGWKPKKLAAEE